MPELTPVRTVELDERDAYQGLTAKLQAFVRASFSGLSDVAAYRATFDCSEQSDATVKKRAHDTIHLPAVQAKLRELRVKADGETTLAPLLTRQFVLNGIMGLALHAEKQNVQLAAYVQLGKTVGIDLFRETVVHERRERSPEDIDRELQVRLKDLAKTIEGRANTIEGSEGVNPEAVDVAAGESVGKKAGAGSGRDRRRKPKAPIG